LLPFDTFLSFFIPLVALMTMPVIFLEERISNVSTGALQTAGLLSNVSTGALQTAGLLLSSLVNTWLS
jgi:hypothetical protein